jgi:hypothetical protein
MNSKNASEATAPHEAGNAAPPSRNEPVAAASSVRPTGEFDPRDGFFPASLASQIEAYAEREKTPSRRTPSPGPRPRVRPAYAVIPAVVAALLVAAWWYVQRDASPPSRAPSASGAVNKAETAPKGAAPQAVTGPAIAASPPAAIPTGTAPSSPPTAAVTPAPLPPTAAVTPAPSRPTATVTSPPPAAASPAPPPTATVRVAPAQRSVDSAVARGASQRAVSSPGARAPGGPSSDAPAFSGGVTHTRGGAVPQPAAPARAAVPVAPAAGGSTSAACSEQLAALGLCAPTKTGR